jgi:hypothetical protein
VLEALTCNLGKLDVTSSIAAPVNYIGHAEYDSAVETCPTEMRMTIKVLPASGNYLYLATRTVIDPTETLVPLKYRPLHHLARTNACVFYDMLVMSNHDNKGFCDFMIMLQAEMEPLIKKRPVFDRRLRWMIAHYTSDKSSTYVSLDNSEEKNMHLGEVELASNVPAAILARYLSCDNADNAWVRSSLTMMGHYCHRRDTGVFQKQHGYSDIIEPVSWE